MAEAGLLLVLKDRLPGKVSGGSGDGLQILRHVRMLLDCMTRGVHCLHSLLSL